MLIWLFLLGITFSFIIPAINFYLSERNISYVFYIFYILFSVVFVFFTFVKYNGLVLPQGIDFTKEYNYERLINSIPALFYYLFLWNYVKKSDRCNVYRGILKYLIGVTLVILPLLTIVDVLQLDFLNEKLITLVAGLVVLILAIILSILLLKDKNSVFRIIGSGFLIFLILVTSSLFLASLPQLVFLVENPHSLFLIGMIIELTLLNYALNLSNLEYRKNLVLEKNYIESLALRSQMNPHFVHNSLNAIQYFIQRNEVELSEDYLSKFSQLIRLFFEYSRRQTITIKEELELLNNYLEIEKLRFEERIEYKISVCKKIDTEEQLIPSMLLQPIVENAVNHGLFHKKGNGRIEVFFKQLDNKTFQVTVKDDGVGINKAKKQFKTSSKNYQSNSSKVLRERLELINKNKEWKIDYSIQDISEIEKDKTGTLVTLIFKQLIGK